MKLPAKLPDRLGVRGGSPTFSGGPASFNYAIGGLPFLSANSPSLSPYYYGDQRQRRTTAPFRKQQFDSQTNPGEQSLDGMWIRSQQSFHAGAGQVYSDPAQDNPSSSLRFHRSKNVDPWTRGQLALLSKTVAASPAKVGIRKLISFTFQNGTGAVAGCYSTNFFYQDAAFNMTTVAFVPEVYSLTTDGSFIFVSTGDGMYSAPILTSTIGSFTKQYSYGVGGGGSTDPHSEIEWVKDRLFISIDNTGIPNNSFLYEAVPFPASPPANISTANLISTKGSPWKWTSISSTTSAIYLVGQGPAQASIFKITLVTTGATSTLSAMSVAATLPGGELAHAVFGYLGDKLAIGTSRGMRMATSSANGDLTYGPLIFESTKPVKGFAGFDRFIWASYADTVDTDVRVARVDLSVELETLRFAWATDLVAPTDTSQTVSLAFCGNTNQLAFATANNFYMEDKTKKATDGFLYSSRIRFSTLEPKNFRNFRVRGPVLQGSLAVIAVDASAVETPVATFGAGQLPGLEDVTLIPGPLQDFMQLKFTLASTGATNDPGAQMYGWQLKALPGQARQRFLTLPLLCFDWETDKNGQRTGGERSAIRRLLSLEDLESSGGVTTLQDLDASIAYDVFIENLEFIQVTPPPNVEGWGGIIIITLRTI